MLSLVSCENPNGYRSNGPWHADVLSRVQFASTFSPGIDYDHAPGATSTAGITPETKLAYVRSQTARSSERVS